MYPAFVVVCSECCVVLSLEKGAYPEDLRGGEGGMGGGLWQGCQTAGRLEVSTRFVLAVRR